MTTGFEGFVMLLPWFQRDVAKWQFIEDDGRWFHWGRCWPRKIGEGEPESWYISLKLPSYSYQIAIYNDIYCWHQAILVFRDPLVGQGKRGWEIIDMPLPTAR